MKQKVAITKDNYKEVMLKRAIILCWVLLALCFVVKICGGNFFEIVCNDERVINVCNFVDNSWIRYVIYFIYFTIESNILLLIIKPSLTLRDKSFWLYSFGCSLFWIIKILYEVGIIKMTALAFGILSIATLYLLLVIFSGKIVMSALVITYQIVLGIVASYIKSISLMGTITESMLVTFIFFIDYFIALILTRLYSKQLYYKHYKKENK